MTKLFPQLEYLLNGISFILTSSLKKECYLILFNIEKFTIDYQRPHILDSLHAIVNYSMFFIKDSKLPALAGQLSIVAAMSLFLLLILNKFLCIAIQYAEKRDRDCCYSEL